VKIEKIVSLCRDMSSIVHTFILGTICRN